jgi:hypothetical protein
MNSATITWTPSPNLKAAIERRRDKLPLYRELNLIMLAMAADAHSRGGAPPWKVSTRVELRGGVTGTLTGRLRRGWRPVAGEARITNRVPYARDFYYGHPRRLERVKAHTRRTKSGRTAKVRAHYRMAAAQVARPINWTARWIDKALDATAETYELK